MQLPNFVKCPACGAIGAGFNATPFGDYFALVRCGSCSAVVGALEDHAIAPEIEELKLRLGNVETQLNSIEHYVHQINRRLG